MSGAGTEACVEAATPAFIDTLSPGYDRDIHEAHRAARARKALLDAVRDCRDVRDLAGELL